MCKKRLQESKLSSEYVAQARRWADNLVMREYQGPGQMQRAIDKAAQRTGIDRNVFWSLRYRPPTDIMVSVYERLKAAYRIECERQARLYEHERQMTRATNETAKALARTADRLAGTKME